MPTIQDVQSWQGQDLYGSDHDKIGEIADIYLDRQTGEPEWLAVKSGGMLGSKTSFVPIRDAAADEGHVHIPYAKDMVSSAPAADADGELSPEEEKALYAHYGQEWGDFDPDRSDDSDARFSRDDETVGRDTSGPTTDQAMTRSEEELRVGKTSEEVGRARLRKYVVTEQKQVSVPVQREEVRIEREPITDGNVDQALDGPAISEEEHEVTLHAETPVVEKQVVAKERVRLDKETVTEERTVDEEVRKEQIEADGDTGRLDR